MKMRDDLFFNNMKNLERVLTSEVFKKDPLKALWKVDQEDVFISQSDYTDFFAISKKEGMLPAEANFYLIDYDFVGPASFHKGEGRRNNRPKLMFNLTLKKPGVFEETMDLSIGFDLAVRHIGMGNIKRRFTNQKATRSSLSLDQQESREDCIFSL